MDVSVSPDKATAGMKRLGSIVTVLVFALVLLMGAAGGTMARAGSMDHHGAPHAPSHSAPSHGGSHKAALTVAAPCCPAAEAPAKLAVTVTATAVAVSWTPRHDYIPGARDIAPEPPPPKSSL